MMGLNVSHTKQNESLAIMHPHVNNFLLHPIHSIKPVHVVYLNQPQEIHVQWIRTLENPLALKKSTFNMLCAMQKIVSHS